MPGRQITSVCKFWRKDCYPKLKCCMTSSPTDAGRRADSRSRRTSSPSIRATLAASGDRGKVQVRKLRQFRSCVNGSPYLNRPYLVDRQAGRARRQTTRQRRVQADHFSTQLTQGVASPLDARAEAAESCEVLCRRASCYSDSHCKPMH